MIITITTRSTYMYMPMSRWGWMIAAHINYCWTHNTCSSIAKTHADALSNYWISRQTEQQGSCLCNCIAHRKWQCKHRTIIIGCVANCIGHAYKLHVVHTGASLLLHLGCIALAVSFSGFHSGCHLICCTDGTVMLTSSLLWVNWSSLVSGLLETVVKVSKPHYNSWTKP